MKVLILATDLFSRGGIARYTSTLASSLGRMIGPDNVDVLCFFDWGFAGDLPRDFHMAGMISSGKRAGVCQCCGSSGKLGGPEPKDMT